jgi:hypothetical protein
MALSLVVAAGLMVCLRTPAAVRGGKLI